MRRFGDRSMENILEKITLYDILGYLFPGSILTWILTRGLANTLSSCYLEQLVGEMNTNYIVFFAVSYLVGILLSEVAGSPLRLARLAARTRIWKRVVDRLKKTGFVKNVLERINSGTQIWDDVLREQVVEALIKSEKKGDRAVITSELKEKKAYYIQYMYGVIQGYSECKRVHSYGSAFIMYRNVALALFIGNIAALYAGNAGQYFWISFMASVLFWIRAYRFRRKRDLYVVTCFLDRFSSN